jgi:hypothetical protein
MSVSISRAVIILDQYVIILDRYVIILDRYVITSVCDHVSM